MSDKTLNELKIDFEDLHKLLDEQEARLFSGYKNIFYNKIEQVMVKLNAIEDALEILLDKLNLNDAKTKAEEQKKARIKELMAELEKLGVEVEK